MASLNQRSYSPRTTHTNRAKLVTLCTWWSLSVRSNFGANPCHTHYELTSPVATILNRIGQRRYGRYRKLNVDLVCGIFADPVRRAIWKKSQHGDRIHIPNIALHHPLVGSEAQVVHGE